LSLFASSDTYLKLPVISKTRPVDSNGQVVFRLAQLQIGTYALSVVYDEDGNGKLNTGFLGVPAELVGFSNNAKGLFGPPAFEKAAFNLSAPATMHIVLSKAKD